MNPDSDHSSVYHVLSFGGGVNSVALMLLLVEESAPLDGVVFADTGAELPETYQYLDITRQYLDRHEIPFSVVSKNGPGLYETAWKRQVIPSTIWRWSTRDYKVNPILRYYRSLGGHVNQYLAIAWNEVERMKDSRVDYVTNLFPLVDRRLTREDCVQIIRSAGLPIPPKSSCYFCPFSTVDRWRWLYETHRDLYDQAMALEEHSKHFPTQRLTDQAFRHREDICLRTLAERFRRGEVIPETATPEAGMCGAECLT